MFLGLRLEPVLQPELTLRAELRMQCTVCEELFNRDDEGRQAEVLLLGAARFRVCVCCKQEVPEEHQTDEYKIRYAAWERRLREEAR